MARSWTPCQVGVSAPPLPFWLTGGVGVAAAEQSELELVEVEYITMPGWKASICSTKSFADLPPNAQAYVKKLEELMAVPSECCMVQPRIVQ